MFLIDEVQKLDRTSRWNYAFQVLNLETRENVEEFTLHAARLPQHRNLNRYRDVLPYDHSRVLLENGSNDYINANTVEIEEIKRKYILSQGPLPDTCGHFWQMVWEQNSSAVIMLNKIIEKNSVKCHPYWPMGEDEELEFSDFRIKNRSERSANSYVVRDLQLEQISTGMSRTVKQFHYMLWPDFGVPTRPETFLNFLYDIRDSEVFSPKHGPPVIHCSAGIGRSGTFCLVDCVLKKAEIDGKPDDIDVKEMLLKLRKYRVGLVQTPEQLRFSYVAIIEGVFKLYPELFESLEEETEESHKRKLSEEGYEVEEEEDDEPPPVPPRKRAPPDKPPRHPGSPETNAEEETLKQKKMVKHIQDGIVDDSSDDDEDEEIIDLSESEPEEDAEEEFDEVVELNESDEEEDEDRLVDVSEFTNKTTSPIDGSFPVQKPLPPLPTELNGEEGANDDSGSKDEDVLPNLGKEDEEGDELTSQRRQKLLPVFSIEEEEGEVTTSAMKNGTAGEDRQHCNQNEKISSRTADGQIVDENVTNQSVNSSGSSKEGNSDETAPSGNKAREETELRQRQRRDEKNKHTAELVGDIKRKMREKELAAAHWTFTKKSLIAMGVTGGKKKITSSEFIGIFKKYDKDGNGTIDASEVDSFLRDLAKEHGSEFSSEDDFKKFKDQIIGAYDVNADGKISMNELAKILPAEENFLVQFREEINLTSVDFIKIWYHYDVDRSGYLETAELDGFLRDLMMTTANQSEVTPQKIADYRQQILSLFDANKDGKIELSEMAQILPLEDNFFSSIGRCELSKEEFDKMFAHYDKDNNGMIEDAELIAFLRDLLAAQGKTPTTTELEAYRATVLAVSDTDKDGRLNTAELRSMFAH
eukprot:gene18949-20855_t